MATADAQQAADHVTAVLQADPVLGPLLRAQASGQPFDANAAEARLQQLGITLPKGMWISGGKVQHENMTVDNIGKALKIAIPATIGAFGVGALAGAGGTAAGAGGGSAAAGGTTAATVGTTTAATTPSLLHSLLPTIIGAGATLAGTGIAAHANTDAAKLSAAQADKALEIQKEQYALQRQDTAPYRALGQGAVGNLGFLAGIDTQSAVPALSSTVPTTPYGQSATPPGATPAAAPTSLGSLGRTQPPGTPDSGTAVSRGSSGLVSVRNPATGLVHLIPADQVSAAQQRGGQLV